MRQHCASSATIHESSKPAEAPPWEKGEKCEDAQGSPTGRSQTPRVLQHILHTRQLLSLRTERRRVENVQGRTVTSTLGRTTAMVYSRKETIMTRVSSGKNRMCTSQRSCYRTGILLVERVRELKNWVGLLSPTGAGLPAEAWAEPRSPRYQVLIVVQYILLCLVPAKYR
jgi:hypothetical protein